MVHKPNVNSASERELEKVEQQFETYKKEIDDLTLDRMNTAPKKEVEPQTKISQQDLSKSKDIYLKPKRTIGSQEAFNEKYRESYEFDKQYVNFIAENAEVIGEEINLWTKPYAGIPAEEWAVPVNKPLWGPRYLAEQIKRCNYHVFSMKQSQMTGSDGMGSYYGGMVVDEVKQRLDARPVSTKRSVFMGATNF